MSSNTNNTKKRRVGKEGDNDGASGGERQVDSSVRDELKSLSSHVRSMMEHTRVLTENVTDMMDTMKSMQGEIVRLRNKNDRVEEVMQKRFNIVEDKQNTISDNMNSRFDDVEDKLSYTQGILNYHEVLLRNQKWEYSAPRPSPAYWDVLDEEEDENAEEFLKDIRQCTEKMRYGTGDDDGCVEIEHSIDAPIPYSEEFLPHWKEFADALGQYQYYLKCQPEDDSDTKIQLSGVELSDTVMDLLSEALESTHFNRFVLEGNHFGRKGIEFALKHLKSNQIMNEFGLYNNQIDNMEQVKKLCKIVKDHLSLKVLALQDCRGEGIDGHEMLQFIINAGKNKVKSLNLCENDISTSGDTFISEFLSSNHMLAALELNRNQLDDNDAIAIANALEHNTNLRVLDVRNNNLT